MFSMCPYETYLVKHINIFDTMWLTFGFSSAMVTLLALLYADTQRIRVRARTRSRLKYSNQACAVTRQCASTVLGSEWLQVITRMKAQSGHGRESPNARYRGPQHHVHAHSYVFPFVVSIVEVQLSLNIHLLTLLNSHQSLVIIALQYIPLTALITIVFFFF